jgi:hypothetical protein
MNLRLTSSDLRLWVAMASTALTQYTLTACIWDSDTLNQERRARPKMAETILARETKPPDPAPLRKRLQELLRNRRETDPAWWNDLAGAHLRLGEAQEAVKLLEPVLKRFDTNYGIHANLGTAYHLLGRYKDAEREIARDLEINPEAHFGLEKYHLALLQYLVRDTNYQYRHVYVDEFTDAFLRGGIKAYPSPVAMPFNTDDTNAALRAELENELRRMPATGEDAQRARRQLLSGLAELDVPPTYREHWQLGSDPKLEEGVIYMASLNPREPACFVMLGVKSLHNRDLNLAIAAYERAIQLGSSQSELLGEYIDSLRDHIREARMHNPVTFVSALLVALPVTVLAIVYVRRLRARQRQQCNSV